MGKINKLTLIFLHYVLLMLYISHLFFLLGVFVTINMIEEGQAKTTTRYKYQRDCNLKPTHQNGTHHSLRRTEFQQKEGKLDSLL